ncbi:MAG: ribosome small subunit-dependent GTPase A [Gammaproteobacteria bacterium]
MHSIQTLAALGWQAAFERQWQPHERACAPARIISQQRSQFTVAGAGFEAVIPLLASMPALTVGDWILLDADRRFVRRFERTSLFVRKAAGTARDAQLIAANVDTLFIVSSLNEDFNLNRIERYLVLAREAGAQPVIVLTKANLCADPQPLVAQAGALAPGLFAVAVNALDAHSVAQLAPWCGSGQTVALMGSSGVGKSTLVNTLLGATVQPTQAIRADDAKGRHTTTQRSLHRLAGGGVLLDTPGMRELQLLASEQSLDTTFAEITALAAGCRFADCAHENEPGCAVQAALAAGEIDARRLANFRKLEREHTRLAEAPAERRERERLVGRQRAKIIHARKREKRD